MTHYLAFLHPLFDFEIVAFSARRMKIYERRKTACHIQNLLNSGDADGRTLEILQILVNLGVRVQQALVDQSVCDNLGEGLRGRLQQVNVINHEPVVVKLRQDLIVLHDNKALDLGRHK